MISRIKGILVSITEEYALVEVNGLYYEVMLPSGLVEKLKNNGTLGQEIAFETLYYIEAGDKKSSHFPRLVGFTNPVDRQFFSLLNQVSGMGVRKALKSLVIPIKEIATAIEMKDASQLNRLPGIGARLADKIIAELNGKTARFALSKSEEPLAVKEKKVSPIFEEALAVLLQLQYKRHEAEEMINKALQADPQIKKVEDLITSIFRSEQEKKVTLK
ncbi:MAG: OB-fold domain-containing protein [candidate division Zixibacteria bacterium]|nr:OB-fold domain-containing protein [candidate division Zixibacteria bacterium]MDD5425106.1 OB-fold domain-containing protein [candidate division Zixibacteria bacterium]